MNCNNCGKPIIEKDIFCPFCGQAVIKEEDVPFGCTAQAPENFAPVQNIPIQTPLESETMTTQAENETMYNDDIQRPTVMHNSFSEIETKKAPPKKLFIALASVLGVALICTLLYLFVAPVNNFFNLMFMSPDAYTQNAFNKTSKQITSQTTSLMNRYNFTDEKISSLMEVTLGDKLSSDLALPSGVNTFSLGASSVTSENLTSSDLSFYIGEEEVVTLNTIADVQNLIYYLQIPQLTSSYIKADLATLGGETTEQLSQTQLLNTLAFNSLSTDSKILEEITNRYLEVLKNHLTDVTLTKNVKGDVHGVMYNYTLAQKTFKTSDALYIYIDFIEVLKNDTQLKSLLVETYGVNSIVYSDFIAELDSYAITLNQLLPTITIDPTYDTTIFTLYLYINSFGDIAGLEAKYPTMFEDETFKILTAIDGRTFAATMSVYSPNAPSFEISAKGEIDNSFKANGALYITDTQKTTHTINFTGLNILDDKADMLNGTFTGNIEGYDFTLTMSGGMEDGKFLFETKYDNQLFFSINATTTTSQVEPITTPSESTYDISNSEEFETYLNEAKVYPLAQSIADALGVEVSTFGVNEDTTLATLFMGSMYSSIPNYYDYTTDYSNSLLDENEEFSQETLDEYAEYFDDIFVDENGEFDEDAFLAYYNSLS